MTRYCIWYNKLIVYDTYQICIMEVHIDLEA